jgi:hypothetical protein
MMRFVGRGVVDAKDAKFVAFQSGRMSNEGGRDGRTEALAAD